MASRSGRTVPSPIKKLLEVDVKLTKTFTRLVERKFTLSKNRKYYKALEISCHGIPWFAFWIAFSWLIPDTSYIQMQVNILFGLVLDIVFVALLKAYARRRRPSANKDDAFGQFGPDAFSFPSGHASRAVFVACFFTQVNPLGIILEILIVSWATAVCVSRVLMHRHYILDVLAGVALGLFTGLLLCWFYIGENTAHWIMNSLSDEKLDGGEFHV